MKTLEEYNKEYHERQKLKLKTGISCDKCKTEMEFVNPNVVLASWPPQQTLQCPNCNYIGYKVG